MDQTRDSMHELLDALLAKYGPLASLLDTKGDYTEEPNAALRLHERAYRRALRARHAEGATSSATPG